MSNPNCIKCEILLDEENRVIIQNIPRNICRNCYTKQQKDINYKKYREVTKKICICCNKSLLLGKFGSKAHATCKKCVEYKMIQDGKSCTKCGVTLTQNNISSGTTQCKECINKKKREDRASKKGKELQK